MTPERLPTTHVLIHAREALTADPRVGELGLEVEERPAGQPGDPDDVIVRGAVSTAERKAGVIPVVQEVLQNHGLEHRVVDETEVPEAKAPDGPPEEL